jgi:hypothetical protein
MNATEDSMANTTKEQKAIEAGFWFSKDHDKWNVGRGFGASIEVLKKDISGRAAARSAMVKAFEDVGVPTPLTEQELRTNLAEAIRRKADHAARGETDAANELDADIAELERRIDELVVADEPCDIAQKSCRTTDRPCPGGSVSGVCVAGNDKPATSPEERATRTYLEAMVADGYEITLVDRTTITVDEAISHLADAGEMRVGGTINVGKPGGSYFNINGWL